MESTTSDRSAVSASESMICDSVGFLMPSSTKRGLLGSKSSKSVGTLPVVFGARFGTAIAPFFGRCSGHACPSHKMHGTKSTTLPCGHLVFPRDRPVAGRYCVAGYRTTLKLRKVTVSVVLAALSPWKSSTSGNDSESYAFNTPAPKPSTVPHVWNDI